MNTLKKRNKLGFIALFILALTSFSSINVIKRMQDNISGPITVEREYFSPKTSELGLGTFQPEFKNWTWSEAGDDWCYSVWGDGTFIYTVGATDSFGAPDFDLLLIKWDAAGNEIWNRTWDGTSEDRGFSLSGDGTFIYTAGITDNPTNGTDLLLVKWDATGQEVWNRTWGGMEYDRANSVWCNETHIYTTGYTSSFGASNLDLLLVQWDSAGNKVWNRTWSETMYDQGRSVWSDGIYVYTTGCTYNPSTLNDLLLIQWDTAGNLKWYRIWNGTGNDYGHSIWSDGSYIYTTGDAERPGTSDYDLLLVKWDTTGNEVWYRIWNGTGDDYGRSIWGYGQKLYTLGYTNNFSASGIDLLLVCWDITGIELWNRTWGGTGDDYGTSVWGDGTYIYTAGTTNSFGALNYESCLIRWNTNSFRLVSGTGTDYGTSVWGDGTYIYTAGTTNSFGASALDLLLVKWDMTGIELWNRTWGGTGDDWCYSVWGDGTFIYTVGATDSFGASDFDLYLVKWDAAGNEIWNRTWDGTSEDRGFSLSGDGTFIYTAGITDNPSNGTDLLLVKWDANGQEVWNRTWGGTENDRANSVWCNETHIYTTGYTSSFGASNLDLLLVQWDSAGNKVWNRTWSETNNDQGRSVWSDGIHIYTAGITDNPSTSSDDLLLIQWDTAGNLIWNRTWGTTSEEQGHSVWGDGTYIYTTGDAERPGTSDYDLLLVQWDSTGSIIRNWTLGGQKDDYSRSIWGDGIYIYTAGFTYSFKALGIDLLLVQWDFVPIASFNGNITDIIANEYVQFSFTGYEGSSSALFQWNFGDGTANSTLRDPVHQFTSAGNFTVTLTVTDIDGDIDILSMVDCINVAPDLIPIANWNSNASVILVDDAVSFTFTGTEGNVETSYEWNFGDDTGIFNNSDLIHTFSTAGNFTISLTVSDIDGDFDTRENTILVLIPSDDFDEDGLTNFQELRIYGTSATNRDTDGDDWSDKEEIDAGTDPLDPLDHPSRPPPGDTFWDLLFKQGIIIPIVGAIVTATVGIVIKRIRTKTKKRKKQAL